MGVTQTGRCTLQGTQWAPRFPNPYPDGQAKLAPPRASSVPATSVHRAEAPRRSWLNPWGRGTPTERPLHPRLRCAPASDQSPRRRLQIPSRLRPSRRRYSSDCHPSRSAPTSSARTCCRTTNFTSFGQPVGPGHSAPSVQRVVRKRRLRNRAGASTSPKGFHSQVRTPLGGRSGHPDPRLPGSLPRRQRELRSVGH